MTVFEESKYADFAGAIGRRDPMRSGSEINQLGWGRSLASIWQAAGIGVREILHIPADDVLIGQEPEHHVLWITDRREVRLLGVSTPNLWQRDLPARPGTELPGRLDLDRNVVRTRESLR